MLLYGVMCVGLFLLLCSLALSTADFMAVYSGVSMPLNSSVKKLFLCAINYH